MRTGYIDDAPARAGTYPASWSVNLLLTSSAVIALLLFAGGAAFVRGGLIRASYWTVLVGLSAAAFVLLGRAVRLLWGIRR